MSATSSSPGAGSFKKLDLDFSGFPPLQGVIGYGSGVFRQHGYEHKERPMVDLVFVVKGEDTWAWHQANIATHRNHYSALLRTCGPTVISAVQGWGPGLYYHPHVHIPALGGAGVQAKYGVVTAEALLQDLREWSWLYLAGRLHKPFALEWQSSDHGLQTSFERLVMSNRRAALSAALILACEADHGFEGEVHVQLEHLLSCIVRLSYDGDIRMAFGENPAKVLNIVHGQHTQLWEIYMPLAESLGVNVDSAPADVLPGAGAVKFDLRNLGRQKLFQGLPAAVQHKVTAAAGRSCDPWDRPDVLRGVLRKHVQYSSLVQTLKGPLTSGAARTVRYTAAKLCKRLKL